MVKRSVTAVCVCAEYRCRLHHRRRVWGESWVRLSLDARDGARNWCSVFRSGRLGNVVHTVSAARCSSGRFGCTGGTGLVPTSTGRYTCGTR